MLTNHAQLDSYDTNNLMILNLYRNYTGLTVTAYTLEYFERNICRCNKICNKIHSYCKSANKYSLFYLSTKNIRFFVRNVKYIFDTVEFFSRLTELQILFIITTSYITIVELDNFNLTALSFFYKIKKPLHLNALYNTLDLGKW